MRCFVVRLALMCLASTSRRRGTYGSHKLEASARTVENVGLMSKAESVDRGSRMWNTTMSGAARLPLGVPLAVSPVKLVSSLEENGFAEEAVIVLITAVAPPVPAEVVDLTSLRPTQGSTSRRNKSPTRSRSWSCLGIGHQLYR